jgi:hypothetical protein
VPEVCQNPACKSAGMFHPNCMCGNNANIEAAEASLADGGQVLQSPTGNIYEPSSPQEATQLQSQGYTSPAPEDLAQYQKEQTYGTPKQQLMTAVEGANDALSFGTAPFLERKLAEAIGEKPTDPEVRRARADVNPGSRALGQLGALVAGGEAAPALGIGKAAIGVLPEATTALGRIAYSGIENAIASGVLSAGDETSRMLTDDPNQSASSALAHIGLSALLGGGFGALARLPAEGWGAIPESGKGVAAGFVQRMGEHLGGPLPAELEAGAPAVGRAFTEGPIPNFPPPPGTPLLQPEESSLIGQIGGARAPVLPGEEWGRSLADKFVADTLPESLARSLGFGAGKLTGIPGAEYLGQFVTNKAVKPLLKSVMPGLIRSIGRFTPSTDGMVGAMRYGLNVEAGRGLIIDSIGALLKGARIELPSLGADALSRLDGLAKSAQANSAPLLGISQNIEHYLPEHASSGAKQVMQAVNYLNQNRPSSLKPAPLDTEQPPSAAQETVYKRTLATAEQPLSVLKRVQNGSLTSKDVKDLGGMYPELYKTLQNQLQMAMVEHLSAKNNISYRMRQGISLFLGQPMDTTMIPISIQKIQASFGATKNQAQQTPAPTKAKKGTSKLGGLSAQDRTPSQAREAEKASIA